MDNCQNRLGVHAGEWDSGRSFSDGQDECLGGWNDGGGMVGLVSVVWLHDPFML